MKVFLFWVQRGEPDFREVRLLTVATRALVTAMTRSGVRRLVCIGALRVSSATGAGAASR